MYDLAKKARAGMKSKAERLAGEKDRKTDSSNWSPAPELNADVKTGMRPVSRRAYKDGGKVADCAPMKRADRKPRKAGGKVEQKGEQPLVDRYINRDLKKANDYRDGKKHVGALKHGGRAKKANGGEMTMEEMIKKNPAPVKKPLGLDKIPLPPRRPANLTPAATNKIKPDESKRMKGDYISPQEIGMKKGGRAKKQDGGPMMMDPRLGIVKPKALEFAQNVVTPGLKSGGRTGKAKGGSFWGSKEFQNAFREARKAYLAGEGPKTFEFKGKMYGTDLMKIPTPPERPRPVQEKVIDVQFGPPKGQMPKTDQMGNPNPGMKKGGRIGKANGGSFGSSAPSAGAGRAPQPLTQSMPGRASMPAAAMANAQGRPFQAGGKFAPPPQMMTQPYFPRTGGDYPAISTQPIQPRTGGDYPAISTMPAPLPQRTPTMMTTMPVNAIPRKSGGRVAKQIGGALGMSADALAQQQQLPQGSPMQGGTFAPQGMAARPSLPMMPNQAAASPSTLMQPTVNAIGRKSGGRTNAKGKTNINIIITAGSKKEPESMVPTPPPAPMGVPPMPAPEAPASPETPPMPPPAAMMGGAPMGGGSPMMGGDMMPPPVPRRAGGRVSKVAHSFKDMTAGSGSGEGRLQKTDIAKRSAHKSGGKVYRSYKDMDAGAGSGKGRMEKTEIQSRKK